MSVFDELSIPFRNPATDAMGYDAVQGKLFCGHDSLELQFKEEDRAFRKNPTQTISFNYGEIEKVEVKTSWLGAGRLILQCKSSEKLDSFPGAGVGEVELRIERAEFKSAKKVADLIEFRQTEVRLAESEARLEKGAE